MKGKTKEDKELIRRRDINVKFSGNGWFNTELTKDWVDNTLGRKMFGKRLLIWDSYRCHICPEVKASCKKNNIDMIVIPGGCTKFLQTLDVSANKPFKAAVMEQFDEWIDKGEKILRHLLKH